jgi:predicted ester cyclase
VVNTGAVDEVPRFISPYYVEVRDDGRYAVGTEGAKEHIRGVRQTYPDLQLRIEQKIAEGECVVTRVRSRAPIKEHGWGWDRRESAVASAR